MAFDKELLGLEEGLQDVYKSLEKVALEGKNVSESMMASVRAAQISSGQAEKLASSYRQATQATKDLSDAFSRHEHISSGLFKQYKHNIQCVKELSNEYNQLIAIQKVLEVSTRGVVTNASAALTGLSKLSNGAVGLATSLTGLTLSHSKLTSVLLEYNKTQFDSMRIGARYGDSMASHAAALDIIAKKTSFSRQEFEDLNLTIKEMTVGIPMTSKAVAELAESFSGKFGHSAERVKKALLELIPLQNKMPDLFDKIQKIQSQFNTNAVGATAAAKNLRNELRAIGASQSDIDKAMNSVSRLSPDDVKMNKFEKSISKSKRDIENSALTVSEKMEPALKAVLASQAAISKLVAMLPSGIMMGVGAFALMGAGAGNLLMTLKNITMEMKMWGGLGKTAIGGLTAGKSGASGSGIGGIGGSVGSLNGPGKTDSPSKSIENPRAAMNRNMGVMVGLGVLSMLGPMVAEYVDKGVTSRFTPTSADDNRLATSKAGTGFLSGASKYGAMGMMMGGPYGALAGVAIGGGIGAYQGWKQGKQITKEQFEEQEYQKKQSGGVISGIAKRAGINVKEGANKKETLEAVKQESDEKKKILALQEMYINEQITATEMQRALAKETGSSATAAEAGKKAWETTRKIIGDVVGGVKDELWVQQQLERAMDGQLKSLQAQLEIVNSIKEGGLASVSGLIDGTASHLAASIGGQAANAASADEANLKREKFTRQFVMNASDNPALRQSLLSPEGAKAAEEAKIKTSELGGKQDAAKRQRDNNLLGLQGSAHEGESDAYKESLAKRYEEEYKKTLSELQREVDEVNANVDKEVSNIGVGKVMDIAKTQLPKMLQEYDKAYADGQISKDELNTSRANVAKLNQDLAAYETSMANAEKTKYQVATASSQKDLRIVKEQSALAEKRAAMASKMGLPQSYEAQKNVIGLAQKQNVIALQQKKASDAKMQEWQDAGVDISNPNLGDKASMDDAVSKYIRTHDVSREDAELKLNQALEERIRTSNEVIDSENKLIEATKTWREGWMDAMAEEVIGAGDFAAVIGIGNKNVGEKNAAGGFASFRYGGTNSRDMSQSELFASRNQTATVFTAQQGQTFGNSANKKSGLATYSDVSNDVMGDPTRLLEAAKELVKNGANPTIAENTSQATQAHADAMAGQTVANGTNASRSNVQPVKMEIGDAAKAAIKQVGVDQPGLESQKKGPDGPILTGQTFDNSSDKFARGADNFNTAVDKLLDGIDNPSGKSEQKSSGSLIRRSGGGPTGLTKRQKIGVGLMTASGAVAAGSFTGAISMSVSDARAIQKSNIIEEIKQIKAATGPARQKLIERFIKLNPTEANQVKGLSSNISKAVSKPASISANQFSVPQNALHNSEYEKIIADVERNGVPGMKNKLPSADISNVKTKIPGKITPNSAEISKMRTGKWARKGAVNTGSMATKAASGALNMYLLHVLQDTAQTAYNKYAGDDSRSSNQLDELMESNHGAGPTGPQLFKWILTNPGSAWDVGTKEMADSMNSRKEERREKRIEKRQEKRLKGLSPIGGDIIKSRQDVEKSQADAIKKSKRDEAAHQEKRAKYKAEQEKLAVRRSEIEEYKASLQKKTYDAGVPSSQMDSFVHKFEGELNRNKDSEGFSSNIPQVDAMSSVIRDLEKKKNGNGVDKAMLSHKIELANLQRRSLLLDAGIKNYNKQRQEHKVKRNDQRVALQNEGASNFKKLYGENINKMVGTYESVYGSYQVVPNKDATKQPEVKMVSGPPEWVAGYGTDEQKEFKNKFNQLAPTPEEKIERQRDTIEKENAEVAAARNNTSNKGTGIFTKENEVSVEKKYDRTRNTKSGYYEMLPDGTAGKKIGSYADGGMIPSGSYVVNQSAASANSDFLNSIGSSWVTGGTPGKDSVMFGIGMANGGSPSMGNALLMPGEAVVPPEFAHIGEAINNGASSFATGGSLDSNAMKDITSGSPNRLKNSEKEKSAPETKVTVDFTGDAAQYFRSMGADPNNGSSM